MRLERSKVRSVENSTNTLRRGDTINTLPLPTEQKLADWFNKMKPT
jgi:hypothetical protein